MKITWKLVKKDPNKNLKLPPFAKRTPFFLTGPEITLMQRAMRDLEVDDRINLLFDFLVMLKEQTDTNGENND